MQKLHERLDKVGPGGRKCPCCNDFHGRTKAKLNRIVRRRLDAHFAKEIKAELNSKD